MCSDEQSSDQVMIGRSRPRLLLALSATIMLAAFLFRAEIESASTSTRSLSPMTEPGKQHRVIACRDIPAQKRLVILVLGQSNAANHGEMAQQATESGVYAFHLAQCFNAFDPMPGASGSGASFMPRLGNLLIQRGMADAVVFAPLAIESTSISEWASHPILTQRLHDTAALLRQQGLTVTHVLWQQGEADAVSDTTSAEYRSGFLAVREKIRANGISAPIYVAQSSFCKGKHNPTIHAALAGLPDIADDIRRGPDTDTLDAPEWRVESCHFSARGLDRVAAMWADALAH